MDPNTSIQLTSSKLGSVMPDICDSALDWSEGGEGSDLAEKPSSVWREWLYDPSSLTQLLLRRSEGNFRVEVKAEEWTQVPTLKVRRCFGPVAVDHKFWSRKVVLLGNDTPWVLAHTLIPEFSRVSPLRSILELNEQPLGEYLFKHPDLIRSNMDITKFAVDAWGRRSLFYLHRKPIMVAEFFCRLFSINLLDFLRMRSILK